MLVVAASPAVAQAPPPDAPTTISAEEIVRRAKAGEAIDLFDATVEGDVDLRGVDVLPHALRCVRCYVNGAVNASDVTFERAVDLSHSIVAGFVDLRGSLFKNQATFDSVTFLGPVIADSARMLEGISFVHARFQAPAAFDRSRVKGQATFAGSIFDQETGFRGTQFENTVNFLEATFFDNYFNDSFFGGRADFSLARFFGTTEFNGVEFARGATFRVADFFRSPSFNNLSAGHDLIFDGATFRNGGRFFNVVSSGSLSLSGIDVTGRELYINKVSAPDVSMDVGLVVNRVHGPPGSRAKRRLLDQLEKSAQGREALQVANRARFVRLSQDATKKHGVEGLVDGVYRNVLGYLVRPRHPFIAFCLLVFAAGLIRAVPEISHFLTGLVDRVHEGKVTAPAEPSGGAEPTGGRLPLDRPASERRSRFGIRDKAHAAGHRLYPVLHPFAIACDGWAKSLSAAFRKKPDIVIERRDGPEYARAVVQWTEFLLYKGLIAVFLLTLSNSNSTLRQILDNVWKS